MKIGFIGLGKMGKNMALNILKSGNELIVYTIRKDVFQEFTSKGAKATTHLSEVAQADIIFLSLPNTKTVNDVLLEENGIIKYCREGQIVVDLSTITYKDTLEIASCFKEEGIFFIDAPVSGMESRAIDGTLTIMCGGEKQVFERIKPLLEYIGEKILYMGSSGKGQLTKLVNQLLYDINVAALAEVLPMAKKLGLDPVMVGEVVNSGTGRSHASEFFIPHILKGEFHEAYRMRDAYKDLVSAAGISADLCIPLPIAHAAITTYQMALLRGYGEGEKGSMIRVFEDLLDVQFREDNKKDF
jgi:3-hydroxyisobutyrate dehydrogenase-like beta-hydroxyacid dehydrogenase